MSKGSRVLIVEDEASMLQILGLGLEKAGYQILAAQDAPTALKQVRAGKPDLMILDVMLPGVSGLDFCRQLRADPSTAELPVIMLSALGQTADRVAGLQAGADEYVVKPVDMAEMTARVAALLERTRRLRAREAVQAGRIVSFIGAKGGVGTTTVVVNTGVAMATAGARVVAVEFRAYPGIFPILLGLTNYGDLGGLLAVEPAAIGDAEVVRRLSAHPSGLRVLCAPEGEGGGLDIPPPQALAILSSLARDAEYVLVDLPSHPTVASQVAIQQSWAVMIVVEPVASSMAAARAALTRWKHLMARGAGLGVLVVSHAPLALPLSPSEIESQLGSAVVGVIPPAADEAVRSQQVRRPIIVLQPDGFPAQAFNGIAKTLMTSGAPS